MPVLRLLDPGAWVSGQRIGAFGFSVIPVDVVLSWAAVGHWSVPAPDQSARRNAFRMAGALVVVPIAEELAFRGALLPRFGLAASSLAFGLLHGARRCQRRAVFHRRISGDWRYW
ncbi:MAG: CPBP family intramembrane metalloprotease [Acidobacteria bacterium]|nr:CPBP family intramembrane metalloprotease [Acidobacteriota bacterium]